MPAGPATVCDEVIVLTHAGDVLAAGALGGATSTGGG